MTFVPHAILLAIAYLWLSGVYLPGSAQVFLAAAVLLPFWALWFGRARPLGRTLLLGPGVAIAGAIAMLVWWVIEAGPIGDLGWLVVIAVAAAIAGYAAYCAIVFAIAAWWRRRRRRA